MRVTGSRSEEISLVSDDVRGIVRSVLRIGYDEREELETLIHEGLDSRSLQRSEVGGYALLLSGDMPSGLRMLRKAHDRASDDPGPAELAAWRRIGAICEWLERGEFAAARDQLERWVDASVHELGLVRVHGLGAPRATPSLGGPGASVVIHPA
jgi:hypothetical protein